MSGPRTDAVVDEALKVATGFIQQALSEDLQAPAVRRCRPQARALILRSLELAGPSGLLTEAIAKLSRLPLASVSARVGEMLRAGEVLPVALRRTTTGRPAWAFASAHVLVTAAGDEAHEKWNQARANRLGVLAHRGRWNGKATL